MLHSRPTYNLLRLGALALLLLLTTGCLVQDNGIPTRGPVLALTPTATAPALPPVGGRIAFRSDRGGTPDLWVISPDGSKLEQITQGKSVGGSHTWSPDGERIAYQYDTNGKSQIYVTIVGQDNKPAQSASITADAADVDNVNPVWSPDAREIVFQSKRGGGDYQLYITAANGGGTARAIPRIAEFAGNPSWAPDGRLIAYVAGADTQHTEIYVAPAAGGQPTQLTNLGRSTTRPLWSPDGTRILFMYLDASGLYHIATIGADGSGLQELSANKQEARFPVWSPDGAKVAFFSTSIPLTPGPGQGASESNNEVYVMAADGMGLLDVSNNQAGDTYPSWAPDGSRLVFGSNRNSSYRLFIVGSDGRNLAPLTQAGGGSYDDGFPVWSK